MLRIPRLTLATIGAGALLATAIGTALPAQAADGDSFTNPTTGTTSTYQAVSDTYYTWDQANAAAAATPAPEGCTNHLAVITSQDEQDFISGDLGDVSRYFIGAQRDANGDFQWVTGEPFGYTHWADGEPNDYQGNEDKLQFTLSNNWNDISSDYTSGYILETECAQTPPPPPAPQRAVVTGVSPTSGPVSGGTTVVITGEHFTGARKVKFGNRPAASYTVDSDTQITAISPAGKLKSNSRSRRVNVRVQTIQAPSQTSSADRFTYTAGSTDS